jgi:aquaporin Z
MFDIIPYIVEGIGTFSLVFVGAGTAALQASDNETSMLIVGIAFALILIVIIYAWGHISGAHVNPALSLAMAFDKRISYGRMVGYILVQFISAILAALLLLWIFGSESTLGSTIGSLTDDEPWKAVVVEMILTFFLVYIVLSVTKNPEYALLAGVIIGLALGIGVMFGYDLTGGSLNPARSFGPALVSGNLNNIWIYFLGPTLGAILAFLVFMGFDKYSNKKVTSGSLF